MSVAVGLSALVVGAAAAEGAPAPYVIVLVDSETGPAGPQYVGSIPAFEARIDLQNAEGGINGRQIDAVVVDDQTSPTGIQNAVQLALSKNPIGIVSNSALFFLAAKYPQQAGVPVTGNSTDGPEWGEQPYTNMFASDGGSVDPKYPVNTMPGKVLKQLGATRVATYGYGISPNSARAVALVTRSFADVGGSTPIQNATVPYGSEAFTADSLVAKDANVNALWPNLQNNSDLALAVAFKQAGIKLKVANFPTGLDPALVHSSVWSEVQGDYFDAEFHPFQTPNAGTIQMAAAMRKYAGFTKTQFPTFIEYESWLGADLMIKGIQKAGASATPATVIRALRGITAYNGNGLLPYTINYSTIFGHDEPSCVWLYKADPNGFQLVSPNPVCGTDIPGTSTAGTGS